MKLSRAGTQHWSQVLALWVLCIGSYTIAVPGSAQMSRFEEAVGVVVVEIPVQVIADGDPVSGLQREDFEVSSGRKDLPVVGFDVVDLSVPEGDREPVPVSQVPQSGRRHFLLLFDMSLSDPATVVKARMAANELVMTALHPSDAVAVATYSGTGGVRLVLGFTSDRLQIDYALTTLGAVNPAESVRDPLGLVVADLTGIGETVADSGGRRQGAFDPGAEVAAQVGTQERTQRRAAQENEIRALTSAMTELGEMMAAVEGRKHVVFLSEGFDASILLGTVDQSRIEEMNAAAASGEFWNVDSQERFGSTSSLSELEQMVDAFRRSDCMIHSVDIGGMRAGADVRQRASGDDGLFMMANGTGGEHYRNYNNLATAMGEMLERTSVTYVLVVQPEDLVWDGSYQKLKVKLKNGPKDARLVYRPGFYAPKPLDERTAMENRLATASQVIGGRAGGQIDTAVLASPMALTGRRAYVPVLIEIEGQSLLSGHAGDVVPTEIYAYAIDKDGSVRDFFTQASALDLTKVGDALRSTGFKFWGSFDLDPGRYDVRTVVRNSATGLSGVGSQVIDIPDLGQEAAAMSPPLFPEAQGKWLMGRESGAQREDLPFPFTMSGQPFVPAARPTLRSNGDHQFCLNTYNVPLQELKVVGQLLDPEGTAVAGAEVVAAGVAEGLPGGEQLVGTMRLGAVAPGNYDLLVMLTDPVSQEVRTTKIPVRVEG